MNDVLMKTGSFLIIITLGYELKQYGVLKCKDAKIISELILKLTLPCALLSNSKEIRINRTTLYLILFALAANLLTFYAAIIVNRKKAKDSAAIAALNVSGFNIGNFAIPIALTFLGSKVLGYIFMFDIGNAICGFGLMYFLADVYYNEDSKFDLKELKKKLLGSVPFITYILMVILSLFHMTIPDFLMYPIESIGNANVFLSMLYIGILMDLHINKTQIKKVWNVLSLRIITELIISITVWNLPVSKTVRLAVLFCMFTPITSITPVYCEKIRPGDPMPALYSTVSIIIAIIINVFLLIFTGGQ